MDQGIPETDLIPECAFRLALGSGRNFRRKEVFYLRIGHFFGFIEFLQKHHSFVRDPDGTDHLVGMGSLVAPILTPCTGEGVKNG